MRTGPKLAGGGLGLLLLVGVGLFLGVDPGMLMEVVQTQQQGSATPAPSRTGLEDEQAEFVSVVLADTEDTWGSLFGAAGQPYRKPTLVLFTGAVRSACGFAQAAMGPFYCPADQKVYIDLSFYADLKERFHAPGDFAQAYVIAHEVGHHVQNLLGILKKVQEVKQGVSQAQANALQVRVELQADCFAGIWAHFSNEKWGIIQPGDVEAAMRTAAAIGDDTLQKRARGYVVPDSFTHGTSEQRQRWFNVGLKSGNVAACNTFKAQQL